jgi:hypothetical protein
VNAREERKPARQRGRKSGRGNALSIAFATAVILAVAIVSFLPGNDKYILHTHGRYHSWGHLLAFSAIGFGVARISHSFRGRVFFLFSALLLGFAIEYAEHLIFLGPLEWKDIVVDAFGVLCGTLLAILVAPEEAARG